MSEAELKLVSVRVYRPSRAHLKKEFFSVEKAKLVREEKGVKIYDGFLEGMKPSNEVQNPALKVVEGFPKELKPSDEVAVKPDPKKGQTKQG